VAHEINNPTNYISLNNENLSEIWSGVRTVLDELLQQRTNLQIAGLPYCEIRKETDRLIEAVGQGTERIQSIVKGLKTFAGSGPVFEDTPVDLNAAVHAALEIIGPVIKKNTTRFSCIVHQTPLVVRGSFQSIEQVIINLVTNACEALSGLENHIRITTGLSTEKNSCFVAVEDGGKGIAAEDMGHIFDPFYTTGRDRGGTGLGLSVSYRIAQAHKGSIEFDSTPGVGTCAVFYLPALNRPIDNNNSRENEDGISPGTGFIG
jgi:signal transduction histidine kinase